MSDIEKVINVLKAEYKLKTIPKMTVQYECYDCGYEYKITNDGYQTINDYYDDELVLTCPKCGCHKKDGYTTVSPVWIKANKKLYEMMEKL